MYGSGLGHISRSLWVASLIDGEKYFSTWGEALKLVNSGMVGLPATPIDVEWSSSDGRMSFRKTVGKFYSFFSIPALQVSEEARRIRGIDPDVVISDSRISPLIASKINSKPSALIINQAQILMPIKHGLARAIERFTGELLSLIWKSADLIMVPDLPPPYTISIEGVSSRVISGKLNFFGFFSKRPSPSTVNIRERFGLKRWVAYAAISGPRPTREYLVRLLEGVGHCLTEDISLVITEGSIDKNGIAERHGNVLKLGWDNYRNDFMNQADVIISRAGLTTLGEGIMAGKPMMLFPIALHGEQVANARRAEELGIARAYDQYKITPKKICEEIEYIIFDSRIKSRAEFLSKVALSIKSEEMVKRSLEALAGR